MQENIDIAAVRHYFLTLQAQICTALAKFEQQDFSKDIWNSAAGGGGESRLLSDGVVLEKAGVNFSHVMGESLPTAATEARPALAGRGFEAMGVSLVVHPKNPYAPTCHMNVRFLLAQKKGAEPVWWFGGGFDLTPYYGFMEDSKHWHSIARDACAPLGDGAYAKYKAWCDDYFYLKHRQEQRGIGGLFFDDLNAGSFAECFQFTQSVGDHFLPAYLPILNRRKEHPYGEREREFQLYRRGRYVEFNLIYDRGTLFGLQSGGRTESILMSLPPLARWIYDWQPIAGSEEEALYTDYLIRRDWLS